MAKKKILEEPSDGSKREQWSSPNHFFLSSMSYTIGLGVIWRFPYLCYRNGGGAFLIPYIVMLIFAAVPLLILEAGIGQHFQTGGISAWRSVNPLFKGIGYGSLTMAFLVNSYYVVLLAYGLLYLFNSFQSELPWSSCDNWWNTEKCRDVRDWNSTESYVTSGEEFWNYRILQKSSGIEEPVAILPELALALFVVWLISFICLRKGVASIGKTVYHTALIPYLLIIALLIRTITLPGAFTGIKHYLAPDFSKIFELKVWLDAAIQAFFSFGLALGAITSMGSYNRSGTNFYHQIFFLSAIHFATALISGLAVFSIIGFLAFQQHVPIDEVARSGIGFAFMTFPQILSTIPWAQTWAVVFFALILLLGFGSQLMTVHGFVTAIMDLFPRYFWRADKRRELFTAIICVISYAIGLSMVTKGGKFVFDLFDYYGASGMVVLLFCLLESIAIGWFYDVDRFTKNIERMVGFKISGLWKICWKFITPTITGICLINSVGHFRTLEDYPCWATSIGWFMMLASILMVPLMFVHAYFTSAPANKITHREFVNV